VAYFGGLPECRCSTNSLIGRESMAPSCYPISTPLPLDTGTVDGNEWRKSLFPKVFRQPDPLSKAAGQWMPVGQWISPTRAALTSWFPMQSVSSVPSGVRPAACVCVKLAGAMQRIRATCRQRVDPLPPNRRQKIEPCTFSREMDPLPPFLLVGGGGWRHSYGSPNALLRILPLIRGRGDSCRLLTKENCVYYRPVARPRS
jgi:hypothetical protein